MMTLDELIVAAVTTHHFRPRMKTETPAAYRVALIDHVEARDFTMAHELRTGKPAAEWTPVEIAQLKDRVLQVPRARQEFAAGAVPDAVRFVATLPGTDPVSEESVRQLAEAGLAALIERRIAEPLWTLPIMMSVLLKNGSLMTTATTERGDRVALLKHIARNAPVFGFFIGADMILHTIGDTEANRTEGIIMHIGTRETRIVRVATYRRTVEGIIFAEPYDIDKTESGTIEDPYSHIF
jgi:hypothetical protein